MTDLNSAQAVSDESPVPEGCEALADPNEILLRHIRMAWYDNGVASSQNFAPMPKDRAHLSVERGSLIDAPTAHSRWTGWGRDSVAVFGVEVGVYQAHGAPSFHVPVTVPPEEKNPEHALVRYPIIRTQSAKLASKAKAAAQKVYEP